MWVILWFGSSHILLGGFLVTVSPEIAIRILAMASQLNRAGATIQLRQPIDEVWKYVAL
jgi:hypothetical protein